MKTYHKILLIVITLAFSPVVYGQPAKTAKELTDEGIKLFDSEKYDEAIAKYKEAIKADPKSDNAYYEMGYTLYNTQKPLEAIPYLETTIKLSPKAGGAYDLLGSIYDDNKQTAKAIEYYLKGISVDPDYQRLYYNLGLTYYRQKEYALAEEKMTKAIKLEPKHASSHRIYAMIANDQNQPGRALLAWCSFLLSEPNTARATYAVQRIKAIINKGIKKTTEKNVNISVAPDNVASLMMPLAVINATAGRSNLSAIDSLTLQLTSLFSVAHTITMDKDQPFVANYFSNYFDSLGKSGNMPAFVRYITLSIYNDENKAWFKEHEKELKDLDTWVTSTKREL
ncbi:MAG: tetratricopeptide repeat protein [Bacteroidota bacterium]